MVKNSDFLVPNPESIFREEEDGAFLFDPQSGNLKYVNALGRSIYQLCDGDSSVLDIKSLVKENYSDIPGEQIDKDIDSFLQDLDKMGFLKKKETG